jgi:hypothetical protein
MEQFPDRAERIEPTEALRDLPPAPAQENVVAENADAVRGGRKAGGGQQDYLVVTLNEVYVSKV